MFLLSVEVIDYEMYYIVFGLFFLVVFLEDDVGLFDLENCDVGIEYFGEIECFVKVFGKFKVFYWEEGLGYFGVGGNVGFYGWC